MVAAEMTEGLQHLGILGLTTLPYSPQQNAKQEVFWAQVEGRLLPMLEGVPDLTLDLLNEATQAWPNDHQTSNPVWPKIPSFPS
jgi:putative transposase